MSDGSSRSPGSIQVGQVAIIALFVTGLFTAQVTASKVLAFDLPVIGVDVVVPAAVLAISVAFLASDCFTELYGRRAAVVMVNVGFAMNFVLLALIWGTIAAPAAPDSVDPTAFADVLGASTNIVIASLVAYLISQNWDVVFFHWLRDQTAGAHLWFRNIASTATSQAIDTAIFITLGFYLVPLLLGIGPVMGTGTLLSLLIWQYIFKLGIVILDTPFVYAIVHLVRQYDHVEHSGPTPERL